MLCLACAITHFDIIKSYCRLGRDFKISGIVSKKPTLFLTTLLQTTSCFGGKYTSLHKNYVISGDVTEDNGIGRKYMHFLTKPDIAYSNLIRNNLAFVRTIPPRLTSKFRAKQKQDFILSN